jgi:hypothetical protein
MQIRTWHPGMTVEETKDLAYWERNVLALRYAEGWYFDDVVRDRDGHPEHDAREPRYDGWRRVLSLDNGAITFHIPDDFDTGTLPEIQPNWDGHTTEEKWRRILTARGLK